MSRWEPNARGRLEQAALELYRERGFDQTTVAEIAERAGLTERTFFRYFTDKREVLFWGQGALQEIYVSTIASAPQSATPIEAVAGGPHAGPPRITATPTPPARLNRRRLWGGPRPPCRRPRRYSGNAMTWPGNARP
jgi:AcrR family transcriptional regulator